MTEQISGAKWIGADKKPVQRYEADDVCFGYVYEESGICMSVISFNKGEKYDIADQHASLNDAQIFVEEHAASGRYYITSED
jgi:hypothetical protein